MPARLGTLVLGTLVSLATSFSPAPLRVASSPIARAAFFSRGSVHGKAQPTETVTVTLGPGCSAKGVGVGLDPTNVVDMLVPGKTAAEALRLGDRVLLWNGNALVDPSTGEQRKLGSVVDGRLDTHAVVVERPLAPLSAAEQAALTAEATRRSGCDTDEAVNVNAGAATTAAPAAPTAGKESAPPRDWAAPQEWTAGQSGSWGGGADESERKW